MIHGKLTREEEGMEDLLTSNIFGSMKYLPSYAILLSFLSLAKDPLTGGNRGSHLKYSLFTFG
jgi:hypothetical protein